LLGLPCAAFLFEYGMNKILIKKNIVTDIPKEIILNLGHAEANVRK